jgi:hypothetical protein
LGVTVGMSGLIGEGTTLLWENGVAYLFVSGTCEYHVFWGDDAWAETRTGVLTIEEELDLRETVRYGAWEGLEGSWPRVPSVIDGSLYMVPLATWSLSVPMTELARDDTDPSLALRGEGVLLEVESDVATIRQLRAAYRDGVHGDFWYRYLPFRDDAEAGPPEYALWARDVTPFEDERGLVRTPEIPR